MHLFKRQTYSGQVVDFIKRCILDGRLSPGEQVKETLLAEQLGISRAPIREALQILAKDGLITSEPQKGKTIRKLTRQEIQNNYEIGGILEGAGVASALPFMTDADIQKLEAIVKHMHATASNASGLHELAEIDDAFHAAMLRYCENRRLVELARSSCAMISKFLLANYWNTLFTPQEFADLHIELLRAVKTGNPAAIEATFRSHYHEFGRRMGRFGA